MAKFGIRPIVFLPPFLILVGSSILSHFYPTEFLEWTKAITNWILTYFGWLFNVTSLCMIGICAYIYFSPLGEVRIGGKNAKPILSKWRWFSILLCTTIAIGILFWGTAEPLFHYFGPPKALGIDPQTPDAARFALSTMFMHWTFTPYGIYGVPALMFALCYYNMKQPYSLGSLISPIFGNKTQGLIGELVDSACLFALMAGMAAALGAGILTIFGGINHIFEVEKSALVLGLIAASIVAAFCISAASGLMKGIRILSDYNIKVFVALAIFVFLAGPTLYIIEYGLEAFGGYVSSFVQRSLYNGALEEGGWSKSWTIFYWAVWMAWAPVTALFLGRLGVGYKVKTFLTMNVILPALFSTFWMMIFSGTTIYLQSEGGVDLMSMVKKDGVEAAVYGVLDALPGASVTIIVFIGASFLSFVTASDSNTEAMSGISTVGISPDSPSPPVWIKFVLGGIVGFIAWFMVSHNGIEGVKQLSNLGGLPALFLLIFVSASLIKVASNPEIYIDLEE